MSKLKVFVYGTLQPSGRLYDLIEPAVTNFESATLNNFAIYKSPYGLYPEAVKSVGRKVQGTLLLIDGRHRAFYDTMLMELEAGYSLQVVEVRTHHGIVLSALSFILANEPRGFMIEGGNWLEYEAQQAF